MASTTRNVVGGLVLSASFLAAGEAWSAERPRRIVVLHVENYARVSPDTLVAAESEASSIYAAAGIRTAWIDRDSDADSHDTSALHLRVLLLSSAMGDSKIEADGIARNVMGQAARPTRRVYVFYSRLSDMATRKHALLSDLLGKVLAHEIGHVLLPAPGHADRGIMNVDLDLRPATLPVFTDAQAADIRAGLN